MVLISAGLLGSQEESDSGSPGTGYCSSLLALSQVNLGSRGLAREGSKLDASGLLRKAGRAVGQMVEVRKQCTAHVFLMANKMEMIPRRYTSQSSREK